MPKKSKIVTTENEVQPTEHKDVQKVKKETKGSDEKKMYTAYVKGSSVQAIADEFKVSAQEVVDEINKVESKRGE